MSTLNGERLAKLITDSLQYLGYSKVIFERDHWTHGYRIQATKRHHAAIATRSDEILRISYILHDTMRADFRGPELDLAGIVVQEIQKHHLEAALEYARQRTPS